MRNLAGALSEGEISRDEFTILAWLGIVGDWRGRLPELHAALRWPHSTSHLGKLLRGLREAGWVEYTARERSRAPFELTLAAVAAVASPHEQRDYAPEAPQPGRSTPLHSQCSKDLSYIAQCHSSLNTLESVETGAPERDDPEARPAPGSEWDDAEFEEAWRAQVTRPADAYADVPPATRRLFGLDNPAGFHGDERTGDGVGDDEASQVRWRGANPSKARRRRRRERE